MIPVDQTRFGEAGNCFTACIASVMELDLAALPDLHVGEGHWWNRISQAVWDLGWQIVIVGGTRAHELAPQGYAIAGGESPRGNRWGHCVVCLDGELVHDPHPDRQGLSGPVTEWYCLIPPRGWRPQAQDAA